MVFLISSDGWRQHKLFPPLSPAKTENADNSSCPIDSFSSYRGWGQTSLLAVIVLIFILKLQLDLPLAGKLSLTFTCRDRYWPCDAMEEAKTRYSIVNNPVSWNFYADRANLHYLVRWALLCHSPRVLYKYRFVQWKRSYYVIKTSKSNKIYILFKLIIVIRNYIEDFCHAGPGNTHQNGWVTHLADKQ